MSFFLLLFFRFLLSIHITIESIPSTFIFTYDHFREQNVLKPLRQSCSSSRSQHFYFCSNEFVYYIPYHLELFMTRSQSDAEQCVLLLRSFPAWLLFDNFTLLDLTDYDVNRPMHRSTMINRRISIDKTDWNQSWLILVFNQMEKENFCSLQIPSIGSECSYRNVIEMTKISCLFNRTIRNHPHRNKGTNHQSIQLINRNETTYARLNSSYLFGFLVMMVGLTSIPWLFFLANLFYNEQIQKNLPRHLKYYEQKFD